MKKLCCLTEISYALSITVAAASKRGMDCYYTLSMFITLCPKMVVYLSWMFMVAHLQSANYGFRGSSLISHMFGNKQSLTLYTEEQESASTSSLARNGQLSMHFLMNGACQLHLTSSSLNYRILFSYGVLINPSFTHS